MNRKGWLIWTLSLLMLVVFSGLRRENLRSGLLVHATGRGLLMLEESATLAPSKREWSSPYRLAMGRRIAINQATEEQLESIPGIGPRRASSIVENRRKYGFFSDVGDLKRVHGIGPRTVQRIAPFVVH